MCHSMGNLIVLWILDKLSKEFKEKFIKNMIATEPSYLGSLEADKHFIGGDKHLVYNDFIGFHYDAGTWFFE